MFQRKNLQKGHAEKFKVMPTARSRFSGSLPGREEAG